MISSELPEVLGMADRVLVVCEGRITADLDRAEATPEAVMHAATHSSGGPAMSDTLRHDAEGEHSTAETLLVEPSRLFTGTARVQHRRPVS